MSQVTWSGYIFNVHSPDSSFPARGGVYVFDKGYEFNKKAYYVGQTSNLRDRLSGHEKWDDAEDLGATHIHIRLEAIESTRLRIEREIIDEYDPPLNDD
ncbi:MAG: GIY-YIG nuclease family protein [Gemmatimonadales bacterium]|nr:GIY-YIG nuclease family protein [Gemmatimonadales bacterium]